MFGDEAEYAHFRTLQWHLGEPHYQIIVSDVLANKAKLDTIIQDLAKALNSESPPTRSDFDKALEGLQDVRCLRTDYYGGRAMRLVFAGFQKKVNKQAHHSQTRIPSHAISLARAFLLVLCQIPGDELLEMNADELRAEGINSLTEAQESVSFLPGRTFPDVAALAYEASQRTSAGVAPSER